MKRGVAISTGELLDFQAMIHEFGMRYCTDSVFGHPEKKWQMKLRFVSAGTAYCTTAYGRTPEEVCNIALEWLKRRGWRKGESGD